MKVGRVDQLRDRSVREQADRIDLQVREIDGHSMVEVRWLVDKDHPVPPVGTRDRRRRGERVEWQNLVSFEWIWCNPM